MIRLQEEEVLLLCSTLGQKGSRPLTPAGFHRLQARLAAALTDRPLRELAGRDSALPGCSAEETGHILALLDRRALLDRYLARAEAAGFCPVTELSGAFPARLREQLGSRCPPVLFCRGQIGLLCRPCVSLVGSRNLREPGRSFARRTGTLAAQEHLVLVSGGARGADTEGQAACLAAGGAVVVFAAGSAAAFPAQAGLAVLSETGFDEAFTAARASSRNRLIHAAGLLTLAAQTDAGSGGTWTGCVENLKRGWSPVFVCDDGTEGARDLILRGASAVPPAGPDSLLRLRPQSGQLGLF